MKKKALRYILNFVSEHLRHSTIPEQVKIYEALALILPTAQERAKAEEIAVTLSEVNKLQTNFLSTLLAPAKP